jgi:heparan-alpha-glucosaminide N-acetyltransferase
MPSQAGASAVSAPRVVSIDIFRGLTMAVMIFVNQLPEGGGLPWWTHHAHAQEDRDDLCRHGLSLLSFYRRHVAPLVDRAKAQAQSVIAGAVAACDGARAGFARAWIDPRQCGKMRSGANAHQRQHLGLARTALRGSLFECLSKVRALPCVFPHLRFIGLAGVIVPVRHLPQNHTAGHAAWIDFSYPEILGLIALSYLAVAILYIPTRRWTWAPPVWFVLLVSLNVLSAAKLLAFPDRVPLYFWPFGNGAMACIIMAGVVTTSIFLGADSMRSPRRSMAIAASFACVTLAAGWALIPLGISKIRATPTWSLFSIGAADSCVYVALLDLRLEALDALGFLCSRRRFEYAYYLPVADLWYFLSVSLGITFLDTHFTFGWPAVLKTCCIYSSHSCRGLGAY